MFYRLIWFWKLDILSGIEITFNWRQLSCICLVCVSIVHSNRQDGAIKQWPGSYMTCYDTWLESLDDNKLTPHTCFICNIRLHNTQHQMTVPRYIKCYFRLFSVSHIFKTMLFNHEKSQNKMNRWQNCFNFQTSYLSYLLDVSAVIMSSNVFWKWLV